MKNSKNKIVNLKHSYKKMSSDKIIPTCIFYNRTKRADRNTINEAKIMKPTKSPYTVYDTTCNYCKPNTKKAVHIPTS